MGRALNLCIRPPWQSAVQQVDEEYEELRRARTHRPVSRAAAAGSVGIFVGGDILFVIFFEQERCAYC